MNNLSQQIEFAPELNDQLELLQKVLKTEINLTPENKKITAWATAVASQNAALVALIKDEVGELSAEEKKSLPLLVVEWR